MPTRQVYARNSPLKPAAKDVEPGQTSHSYGDGKFAAVTLRGNPVDKSRTGRVRATKYIYALNFANWALFISILINVVYYTMKYLYQDVSTAATISTNFVGTGCLLAVFGGFISDALLGHYISITVGTIIQVVGLALLLLSTSYSKLQPPTCTPLSLTSLCPPAGGKYTTVLYIALYTIALGTGINHANIGTFGAEQFDESDPNEQKESIHFFLWLYFSQNVGAFLGFTLTVYILNFKSKEWAFGYLLPLVVLSLAIFLIGTPKYRHKKVGGSFLTRILQVTIAALRKSKLPVPGDESRLHDEPVSGGWNKRTEKLRFLDKASIIEENHLTTSKWRLPGITQVEETKRIYTILPVWLATCFLAVAFAQVVTFTSSQGVTLDRKWGPHFEIPPQTLGVAVVTFGVLVVPIYDWAIMPLLRKITGNPYGISPLKRTGVACLSACLSMVCAALVERKRLTYIRHLGYTQLPFFQLPMSMWWLLPQYFFCGLTEMFLFISLYEFYYHEVSDATRSIAVSFLFSALAVGYFFSSVIVNITNDVTKHHPGGQWLKERINNGGLERYYWLLAIIGAVNFVYFLVASHFYRYNYDLFHSQSKGSGQDTEPHSKAEKEIELEPEDGRRGGLNH